MAAPTFVAEYETAWDSTTTPKTAMNAVAINAGDVLVAYAVGETNFGVATLGITENGSASWVEQQRINVNNFTEVGLWTYVCTGNETITVTFTSTSSSLLFGGNVLRFSGSDGVGTGTSKENGVDGGSGTEPSLNITTGAANSAVVIVCGDWNARDGTSRTWRNNVGSAVQETTYFRDAALYVAYGGYHADCGAAGTYAVGLSAPVSMTYSIAAVEVKGSASATAAITGTATASITEAHVVAGGKTIIITLTGDTFIAA